MALPGEDFGEHTMKRSRVNEIIAEADAFIRSFGYILPPNDVLATLRV
jgi:D-lyxose ketol-isomerase